VGVDAEQPVRNPVRVSMNLRDGNRAGGEDSSRTVGRAAPHCYEGEKAENIRFIQLLCARTDLGVPP
jgi:hypothetical protein